MTRRPLPPEPPALRSHPPLAVPVVARPLVFAAILALLTVFASAAVGGSAAAQGDPWGGAELAFVGPDGRLYAAARDGTEPRPVSPLGERAQFPAWSPTGDRISAIVSDGRRGRLMVYDADGSATELYAASGARSPIYHYWSPAGDAIGFLANAPETGLELRIAAADGAAPARRLAGGSPFYWQWGAAGERLLIHTGFSGPGSRFGFTSAARDTLEENLQPPGFFQAPGIAPSGDWVAFSALTPGGARRVTLEPFGDGVEGVEEGEGGERRQVTHEGLVALAWSPVEDRLAFTAPDAPRATSAGPLRVVDADDGFLRTLIDETVVAFFWSPDGERIAYLTLIGPRSAPGGVAQVPGGAPRGAELQRVQNAPPLLRLSVIEIARGSSPRTLVTFAPTPLWIGQFLPFFDQYALSHRIWSPDGRALALPMRDERGVSRVTVVELDGTLTPLAVGDMPFWR